MEVNEADVVSKLLTFGETVGANELVFASDKFVGNLLRDDPFGFLLASSIDRGRPAESIWQIPAKIRGLLGHLDPCKMAKMSEDELLAVIQQIKGKPRYPRKAARAFISAALLVCNNYQGDTRNIWIGRKAWDTHRRLQEIKEVGPGIATMIILLLERLNEIVFDASELAFLDIKPDVHTRRVLRRLGFTHGDTDHEAIQAARRLYPTYPGKLDAPLWEIGRKWCRPQHPKCSECVMVGLCSQEV
ncbi:MAG: hypothetical protein HYZ11_03035 [Candidatus Tectomicrobia bacterium]|uniref:HhH-GPD domain-containing protein n=1 Tax=Tectimicrobiota bacterium TaxID=2528274 RepID=A0A932HYC1_UNCTE|nr:hypothetical protein [Candidatus Tectomicrobia bacterium]